jgi:hypothetical protein
MGRQRLERYEPQGRSAWVHEDPRQPNAGDPRPKGNKRTATYHNLLTCDEISLAAVVPGRDDLLEMSGTAFVSDEPGLVSTMAIAEKPPKAALIVDVARRRHGERGRTEVEDMGPIRTRRSVPSSGHEPGRGPAPGEQQGSLRQGTDDPHADQRTRRLAEAHAPRHRSRLPQRTQGRGGTDPGRPCTRRRHTHCAEERNRHIASPRSSTHTRNRRRA